MVEPSYQELSSSEIPSAHPTRNVLVKVICGESDGSPSEGIISSPVRPLGGCWFTDYTIKKKGEKVFQRIPKGWNAFVSFFPFSLLYSTLFSLVDTALCFFKFTINKTDLYTLGFTPRRTSNSIRLKPNPSIPYRNSLEQRPRKPSRNRYLTRIRFSRRRGS